MSMIIIMMMIMISDVASPSPHPSSQMFSTNFQRTSRVNFYRWSLWTSTRLRRRDSFPFLSTVSLPGSSLKGRSPHIFIESEQFWNIRQGRIFLEMFVHNIYVSQTAVSVLKEEEGRSTFEAADPATVGIHLLLNGSGSIYFWMGGSASLRWGDRRKPSLNPKSKIYLQSYTSKS